MDIKSVKLQPDAAASCVSLVGKMKELPTTSVYLQEQL
jgi:hypothetical protein